MRRAEVVALGLLQGPAELLPVSSSGHVAALPLLLGWEHARLEGARRKEVEVALHAGGGGALLAGLRRELMALRIDVAVLSLLPAVALAFAAERWIETRLGGPRSLAAGLGAGAAAPGRARRAPAGGAGAGPGPPRGSSPTARRRSGVRRTRARSTGSCSGSRRRARSSRASRAPARPS